MSLLIDRLVLEANTADGPYGIDLPLSKGLFILRVENSHGKSTCMNAIAYALGMEMALGQQSSRPPFPPSLLKSIQDETGAEKLVISSNVKLQISNSRGSTVTLYRNILGADADTIITCFNGGVESGNAVGQKLFLHREGDTSRGLGFYHWLSDFIGWEIPFVPNNYGKESPLYPAILFPLFFIEQKKGWGSIQATTPFHFQINQAKKRAFEFIMDLDVNEIIKKKAKNRQFIDEVVSDWGRLYARLENVAIRLGGKVVCVEDKPFAKFESFKVDVLTQSNDQWTGLSSALENSRKQLLEHVGKFQSNEGLKDQSVKNRQALKEAIEKLREGEIAFDSLQDEISFISGQIEATEIRIDHLLDDKRKYEDLKKVKSFDVLRGLPILENSCPTCGQEYSDHAASISCSDDLMTLDESLDFIKSQISTFNSVLKSYKAQRGIKLAEKQNLDNDVNRLTNDIERLKNSLYSDKLSVDEEFLREKIRLEITVKNYEEALVAIADFRSQFSKLHEKYKELTRLRKGFPEHGFSNEDNKKLSKLESSVIGYLSDFGFSSFDPKLMKISRDSYLPTREGFDLGFDTSASDGIRVIWSYLISLFSMRDSFVTNHPGVLIFDEPRQQEANKLSFAGLLKGAAESAKGGQIIFATSEEESVLAKALDGSDYSIKSFSPMDGKILRRL